MGVETYCWGQVKNTHDNRSIRYILLHLGPVTCQGDVQGLVFETRVHVVKTLFHNGTYNTDTGCYTTYMCTLNVLYNTHQKRMIIRKRIQTYDIRVFIHTLNVYMYVKETSKQNNGLGEGHHRTHRRSPSPLKHHQGEFAVNRIVVTRHCIWTRTSSARHQQHPCRHLSVKGCPPGQNGWLP
jgi:hypothetical protein